MKKNKKIRLSVLIKCNGLSKKTVYNVHKYHKNKNIYIVKKTELYNYKKQSGVIDIFYNLLIMIPVILILLVIYNCELHDNIHSVKDYYINMDTIDTNSINKPFNSSTNNNVMKPLVINVKEQNSCNYNDSVILNKIKDLHFKQAMIKYNNEHDKILQLEAEINNNKTAYKNLIEDIHLIIKEYKP